MLNWKTAIVCLVAILGAAASVLVPGPARLQVDDYLKGATERWASSDDSRWESRAHHLLAQNRDLEVTARTLAATDGLSVADEKGLIALLMTNSEIQADVSKPSQTTLEVTRRANAYRSRRSELQRQTIDLIRTSGHTPFVIEVALRILNVDPDHCDAETFETIVGEAPAALSAGMTAARQSRCAAWWLALQGRFPENAAVLFELSRAKDDLTFAERLALLERMSKMPPTTQEARVAFLLEFVRTHWEAGLTTEGLALIDNASEDDRQWMLSDRPLPREVSIGGQSVQVHEEDRGQPITRRERDFRLDYIVALHLAGRTGEAHRAFEALPYTRELRSVWSRLDATTQPHGRTFSLQPNQWAPLADNFNMGLRWRLIESALSHESEDPYFLVEHGTPDRSAIWIELSRRRLTGDNYRYLRGILAESWQPAGSRRHLVESWPANFPKSIRPDPPPMARYTNGDFRRSTERFEQAIASALSGWGPRRAIQFPRDPNVTPPTPPPLPDGFKELPVPRNLRTARGATETSVSAAWPSEMSPLPAGFQSIRVESGPDVTVAVSWSHNLDRTGEVSVGGYWIHLSHDKGKSWQPPLYTGLQDHFPYAVVQTSKLPLWSGDRVNLEVEVQEIAPSTITYPPVGLGLSRQASNVFIEIPLAALQSDRDHDGLTDIVEQRLLLDPVNHDSDGDGLADGQDLLPNVANTLAADPAGSAISALLRHVLATPKEAGVLSPWLIAIRGVQAQSFRPDSMTLIYGEAEIARIQARSLDFNPLEIEVVAFDRAGNRAVIGWNARWHGGSARLTREGNSWRVEVLSHWIT